MDQGQSFVISDVRFNKQIGYHFFSSENERKCYKIYNKVKKSSDNSDILNVGCIRLGQDWFVMLLQPEKCCPQFISLSTLFNALCMSCSKVL